MRRVNPTSGNSATTSVAGILQEVPHPYLADPLTELEQAIWRDYTRARPPEDWMPHELRVLHQLVKIEATSVVAWGDVGNEITALNRRGEEVQNPVMGAAMKLTYVAMTLRSRLGLAYDVRLQISREQSQRTALIAHQRATIIQEDGPGGESLLAAPETP